MATLTFWNVDMGDTACIFPSPKTSAQFLWHTFIRFLKWYSLSGLNALKEKPMEMNSTIYAILSKLILIIFEFFFFKSVEHSSVWQLKMQQKLKFKKRPPLPSLRFYKTFWSFNSVQTTPMWDRYPYKGGDKLPVFQN